MGDNEMSQEVREQLELARSRVRRNVTYGAGALLAAVILWGTMWMGDRSIAIAGITFCASIISYWFGTRSVKPPEIK